MLRLIESAELNYFQESPNIVSKRARRFLEIINSSFEPEVPVSVASLRKFLGRINVSKSKGMTADILYSELSVLIGTLISQPDRVLLACSIAGAWRCDIVGHANIKTLDVPEIDVWAKIVDLESIEIFRKKGFSVTFVICNSSLAGNRVIDEVDYDRFSRVTKYMGIRGDRRRMIKRKPMHWYNANQAMGGALILRVGKVAGQLVVSGCGFHARTKEFNKNLAIARDRRFNACPYGAKFHCAQCEVGMNECELSCVNLKTNYLKGKKK